MGDVDRPRCSTKGCGSLAKVRGLCYRHYDIARANGKTCTVDGCPNPPRARGYCSVHYYRWHKHGDAGEARLRRKPTRPCAVVDCTNTAKTSADLCPTHARRKRLYGNEDGMFATHKKCIKCAEPAASGPRSSDHCRNHYIEYVKSLVVAGEIQGNHSPSGYRYIAIFKRLYAEHSIVMEHKIGRPLDKGESVHHRNGIRHDNRPANLELWVRPQPTGQRAEDLVAWVVEHYPDLAREKLAEQGLAPQIT